MYEDMKIDYDVVDRMAGHQPNKQVPILEAAENLFKKVKEKAMQVSVKGTFIEFDTIDQLIQKLGEAATNGWRIACYDQNRGG